MHTVDTVATILLFVVLLGWVGLSVYAGAMSVTLSDSGAPGVAMVGVVLAVIGIPASVIAVYVAAIVYAWRADGYTFLYPLAALAAGTLLAVLVAAAAFGLVRLGLRVHGTDADRRPAAVSTPAVYTFDAVHDYSDDTLSIQLGIERCTGRRYLRTPMPQRDGEYREYHGLDVAMYELFSVDRGAALSFAGQCRAGLHEDRWLPPPGAPAAGPASPDRKHLAGKRAILLTDHPTDASGSAILGLPVGTAFVWIVANRVDSDGNLQVRPRGEGSDVISVDARQLGVH